MAHNLAQDATVRAHRAAAAAAAPGEILGLEATFERDICRSDPRGSDTAALPKVSTGLPTNSIELERLGGWGRARDVGNADFSPMC